MCSPCHSQKRHLGDVPPDQALAVRGNSAQPAVTQLSRMPPDIMDHISSFIPYEIPACRTISRVFRQVGEGFLQDHALSINGLCSHTNSSLYSLLQGKFASFRGSHYQSHPHCSYLEFHFFISRSIASLGVRCPNGILSLEEMDRSNNMVQRLQDASLERIWNPLREKITQSTPAPAGIPGIDASAQQIRRWMHAPANQAALQRITRLSLKDLKLTCVPLEIRLCTGLQELNLSNNLLTSLPENLFQGLVKLQWISLTTNQLTTLPEGLFQGLTGLQWLYLSFNPLATLPKGLFQGLTGLQRLYLSFNPQLALPKGLFQGLVGLQQLLLDHNRLVILPEGLFEGLAGLETLDLSYNHLASPPANLFEGLPELKLLSLCGNPGLLFNALPAFRNNIGFRKTMRTFFSYPCETPFARVYQLVAGNAPADVVRERLYEVPESIRENIFYKVWEEAGRPYTGWPLLWGKHHAFDNMQIFAAALRRYVSESLGKGVFDSTNILRDIDGRM